jgi:hypothetical protein
MKRYLTEVFAFLIALFVLFGAGGCVEKSTEWHGVRDSAVPLTCGRNAEHADVYTCVSLTDGSVWTCVGGGTYPRYTMTCAETAAPPSAEAKL